MSDKKPAPKTQTLTPKARWLDAVAGDDVDARERAVARIIELARKGGNGVSDEVIAEAILAASRKSAKTVVVKFAPTPAEGAN